MAAWLVGSLAAGQEAGPVGPASDPVIVSADAIRFWDEGPVRWVVLDGRAAAFQGTEGLRADRGVARIAAGEREGTYRIEVHLEREGSGPERRDFTTRGTVELRPHRPGGLSRCDAAGSDLALVRRGFPDGPSEPVAAAAPPAAPRDETVQPAQFEPEGFTSPSLDAGDDADPLGELPPLGETPITDPTPDTGLGDMEGEGGLLPPSEMPAEEPAEILPAPISPMSRRTISIGPRDSGSNFKWDLRSPPDANGNVVIQIRGGLNLTAELPGQGTVDLSADSAVIWTRVADGGSPENIDPNPQAPLEVYLEGNVVFRQDRRIEAGNGDQTTVRARQFYVDLRTMWFVAQEAEMGLYDARLLAPIKVKGQQLRQYRPIVGRDPKGKFLFGMSEIHADSTLITGSRFPVPGYRFQSRSVDLRELNQPLTGQDDKPVANPKDPMAPGERVWRIDARQNIWKIGGVPVFYWPRIVTDSDDLDPPLRQINFRVNNYFGTQFLTDWNMFKLLGVKQPSFIDTWNLDLDYLSYRGFAAGSELGWSGRDLWGDLTDPYHRNKSGRDVDRPYFGYFDLWGLKDFRGRDTLGPGFSILTNSPGVLTKTYDRLSTPYFADFRGRTQFRHMQSLLSSDAPFDQDFRLQVEAAYLSDRNFLEQYYKRLFDTGLDEVTLAYGIYQHENRALTLLTQGNLQYWYTDTQWFPKLDYYRLGDSLLGNRLTLFSNSGADYANVHTATEVSDPNLFPTLPRNISFIPYDPVSATSGPFRTGRLWTSHELDLPIDLNFLRVTPYAQGQLVGWDNQFQTALPNSQLAGTLPEQAFIRGPQGSLLGRAYYGVGGRANVMAWRNYSAVENEMLNIHGLSHKINFDADFRHAASNVSLNRLGIQDTLDDNTYEYVRRYFALTNYRYGILPPQYDPRFLTLRRTVSPITGTTDIQDDMDTLQLAIRQRLQTKRGPEGRRRIIDWMTFDLSTTYFPNADRDNFGKSFGQNMYNWEWYIGDRTSILSQGWFEFWDVTGSPILSANPRHTSDPFGLKVINSGVSLSRPPRGNVYIGYAVINTGVIATSALNVAMSYWLSPKWYGSFATSYDFGNAILLGSTFGITRIGADFLTSVGLTVDPQRESYMFGFELTPRLSPSIRLGSGGGLARFDPRFAPVQ